MDKHQLATLLNGRQMGKEITREEELKAKGAGLVVVFGYSDDGAEFRGVIDDEAGCFNGATIYLNKDGVFEDCEHADRNIDGCKYIKAAKAQCKTIEAVWDNEGYSWTYKTDIPHATFDVLDDDEKFCRGIVFEINDL